MSGVSHCFVLSNHESEWRKTTIIPTVPFVGYPFLFFSPLYRFVAYYIVSSCYRLCNL